MNEIKNFITSFALTLVHVHVNNNGPKNTNDIWLKKFTKKLKNPKLRVLEFIEF